MASAFSAHLDGRRRARIGGWCGLLIALLLTAAGPADGRSLELGVSLKYFGDRPGNDTALEAVAPSLDRFLTAVNWGSVQPTCQAIREGSYDWNRPNRALSKVAANGLEAIVTLKHGPPCSHARGGGRQPKRYLVDDWARFAQKFAARYGPGGRYPAHPVTAVEVWSEPNLSWSTGPRAYARAFMRVKKRVRRGNPAVKVITGGLANCCKPWLYLELLYDVTGFGRRAGIIGAHTYAPRPADSIRRLENVRETIRRNGRSAPIYVTEHGWATCARPDLDDTLQRKCVTEKNQAIYQYRLVQKLRLAGGLGVQGFMWFQAQDLATWESTASCPITPDNHYGFWWHDGSPKLSLWVWETLTETDLPNAIPPSMWLRDCPG